MNKNIENGDNGLASHNESNTGFNFFYPAGGGSLNSTEEIFDYWKRTNFSYAISCREFPTFRAILMKEEDGEYVLNMCDNENPATTENPDGILPYRINCGKRLTNDTKNWVMEQINRYIKDEYIDSRRFKVCFCTPDVSEGFYNEIFFNKKENALAFIALIKDEALTDPGYEVLV